MKKQKFNNLAIFLLCSIFLTLFEPFGTASANAVSYTPLDVYKRQKASCRRMQLQLLQLLPLYCILVKSTGARLSLIHI